MKYWLSAIALGLALVVSLPAAAEPAPEPDRVMMNMRDADIRALIQWVSDLTGRNIVVHRDVQGRVNVVSAQPVTTDEAYELFLSVLQVNGFVAVDTPEAIRVVPAAMGAQSGVSYGSRTGSDMVVQVFRADNISSAELVQMLRPILSREAVITPYPATNSVIIADRARQLATAENLIRRLDRIGDASVEVITLQHANAADILQSLSALFPSAEGLPLQLSIDVRSNSLLVAGESARRKQVRDVLKQLDQPIAGEGNTQVLYLQYVDAAEIAPILRNLAQSLQKEQHEDASGISIDASQASNALVINAPATVVGTLRRVVEQLDIRRAQVLVEAVVVEVSGDIGDDIGVSWLTTEVGDLSGSGGFGAVNTLGGLGLGQVVRDSSGNILGYQPGRGATIGYYNRGNLQAAIRALESSTRANILSTPVVVALDNEPASLLVGQNVPFRTGEATGAASPVDNPFTTIQRQDIGISLAVTPRINRGDAITLDIEQRVESIAPSVSGASDLITNKREIITKALIRDGQILVLGGLISDEETEVVEKVPVLGSMPIVGGLFRGRSTSREKRNLMVFIHPVIIKDDEHMRDITQRRYNFMQERQQAYRDSEALGEPTRMPDFSTFRPREEQQD